MALKQTKTERKLRSVLQQELANAEGADQNEAQAQREAAVYLYKGEPVGVPVGAPSETGFEDLTSTDVSDMVNAVLAQLTPMLTTDALVTFEAKGKQDEAAARAESDAVQTVIVERSGGYVELQEAIKDLLMMRNGCVKCLVEEDEEVRYIEATKVDENGDTVPFSGPEKAVALQPKDPREVRTMDGDRIKVVTTTRDFRLVAVPMENVSYQANADNSDIQSYRFVAERLLYTRSDLVEKGFSKKDVWALPYYTDETNQVSRARNKSNQIPNVAETRDQDIIECHECYIRIDLDNDGVSELYRVLFAGGTYVLEYETVDLIPYAIGTAIIQSHRLQGESITDRMEQTQRAKTMFLRLWARNASFVSQGGRWAGDPRYVNFDDLTNSKLNAPIRLKDSAQPPMNVRVDDAGPSMHAALTYQDKMRTERGGAALDMVSADMQLVGETAHGVERQYAQRELMVSMYARNIAETLIRPAYLIMHYMLRKFSNEVLEYKMGGEWQQGDPRAWPKRIRCTVKAGMSAGERAHLQRVMQTNVQMQMTAMQAGMDGVLADPETVYNAVYDYNTMAGVDNPDSYWINPKSEQAQQAAQQKQQSQQQQQQQQQQAHMQLIQAQLKLEYAKLQQKAKEADDKVAYQYWSDRLNSEVEEMKLSATGAFELEKVQMQGEQRETQRPNGAEGSAARTRNT